MTTNTVTYLTATELIGNAIKNALSEMIESRSIPYEISALTANYSPNDSNGIIVVNIEFKPNDPTVTFDLDKIIVTLVNPKGGTLVWYLDEPGYHVKLNEAIDIAKHFFRDNKPIAKNIKLELYRRSDEEEGD